MKPIIEVRNLSKQYKIGQQQRYLSLRDSLSDFFKFRDKNTKRPEFWALDDISFDVQAGESIGIIGRNGAGKSTLLKILSRITPPTKGSVILRGRIASLLEVGTGFHPELSGRENVFMNGSILGLRKAEIKEKFDEIVAFSGVEQFIDTPLKHYSSGMQLRLAFAVAAHLEPEILIIDEVLAVGDAEFQKKCLGKMDEVSKSGRTVIFVSHNLTAMQSLCSRCVLMEKGKNIAIGETTKIINQYINTHQAPLAEIVTNKQYQVGKKLMLKAVRLKNSYNELTTQFSVDDICIVEIDIAIYEEGYFYNISIEVLNYQYGSIFTSAYMDTDTERRKQFVWEKGLYQLRVLLPLYILRDGQYIIRVGASRPNMEILDNFEQELYFTFSNHNSPILKLNEGRQGVILPILEWSHHNIKNN